MPVAIPEIDATAFGSPKGSAKKGPVQNGIDFYRGLVYDMYGSLGALRGICIEMKRSDVL